MATPQLRLAICGSVDDGKSTLIGRLLFDSQAILADQIDARSEERRVGKECRSRWSPYH